ncbi:hypothetical protein IJO12_06570 [bacterium]|nr:hypothetical protein [bacterium]
MQTVYLNQDNTSFKQIKLSAAELEAGKDKFKEIIARPLKTTKNYELFDIFESHLNKEVDLKKYSTGSARKDFSTKLYLNFFRILKSLKASNGTFENFIDELNNFSENFVVRPVDTDYSKCDGFDVTRVNNLADSICDYLKVEKGNFLEKAQTFPILQYAFEDSIPKKVRFLAKELGFKEDEFISFFEMNPKAFIYPAKKILKNIQDSKKILKINDDEEFRELVRKNPHMLLIWKLQERVDNLKKFLNKDEDTIISAIKDTSHLAVTPMDYMTNNFYTMKNYLNVDREKMEEIVVQAPITITKFYKDNKKNIEDMAKRLNMSPEDFIQSANTSPVAYKGNLDKLNKWLRFISQTLECSTCNAKKYIIKSISLLGAVLKDTSDNVANNYKILNEEFDIDHDTYVLMLRENSHIMTEHDDVLKQKNDDFAKYYNLDNPTHRNMIIKNSRILTKSVDEIDKNLSDISKEWKIEKEKLKQMCIKEPILATKLLKYYKINIPHNAGLLGMSIDNFMKLAENNPVLLTKPFKTVAEICSFL